MMRVLLVLLASVACGCAAEPAPDPFVDTGLEGPLDPMPDEGKPDAAGARGPRVRAGSMTEVWRVTRAWTDAADATGRTWEEAYARWIAGFVTVARDDAYGETFVIDTPFGDRALPAPALECAEVALLLRAAFASFHGLPFFVQGWDARSRRALWAGHFGFVDADGRRALSFPKFRIAYADYTDAWAPGDPWPRDARLRRYRLGDDDAVPFLGAGEGAGAYLDEMFLNKRVGYFLRLLLLYFGSANLADPSNTFHVAPDAIVAGDILLERWQRRGIGHTIPVMRVLSPADDRRAVHVATGSMPRRQPLWEEPARARHYFSLAATGGEGTASDGTPYAKLGGGLRRWRSAVARGGRFWNVVLPDHASAHVDAGDLEAIAARPARFRELLSGLSPEEEREGALARIEAARRHLRDHPSSCAARTRREDAFDDLYVVLARDFGLTRGEVDARYRLLEDAVLAELDYGASKTCCWSSTTPAMFDVVMQYAEEEQRRAGACTPPTVFRAEVGGFERWRRHAEATGRPWLPWREDEPCPWRDVIEDTVTGRGGAACASVGCDPTGGGDRSRATDLSSVLAARLCEGEDDWYRVPASGVARVRIAFRHAEGDLDLEAVDARGERIDASESVRDEEVVEGDGTFYVRVYGYGGAGNAYVVSVSEP